MKTKEIELRDYFAAKAMLGFISIEAEYVFNTEESTKTVTKRAYELADAMIEERKKNL